MWDDIIEIVIEVILEILVHIPGGKSFLKGFGISVWFIATLLIIWSGIAKNNVAFLGLGMVSLVGLGVWLYIRIKRYYNAKKIDTEKKK